MRDPSSGERRRLRRVVTRIYVSFRSPDVNGLGHIKNINKEGVFIRSFDLPPTGSNVRLVIELSDGPKVEVTGVVAWTTGQLPKGSKAEPGFGVKLDRCTDPYHDMLERILLGV